MAPALEASPQPAIVFAASAEVTSDVVTLGQIADLSGLPPALAAKAKDLAIVKLPRASHNQDLPLAPLERRIGIVAPSLKPWLAPAQGEIHVRRRSAEPTAAAVAKDCAAATRALTEGDIPTPASFVKAACTGHETSALALDPRSGVLKVRRAIHIGETLPTPPATELAGVAPGDTLFLQARVGPVKVERRVEAVQAGRPGGRLFVKAANGAVMSVAYPTDEP